MLANRTETCKPAPLDRRAQRTRRLLLQAFFELGQEKDFQSITVQDIADRADVNRATFYDHFADKYVLLEEAIREIFLTIVRRRLPPDATLSSENIQQLILAVCELWEQIQPRCRESDRHYEPLIETEVKSQLRALLLCWLSQRKSHPAPATATLELTATITSWAIYGAASLWQQGERSEPATDFARRALPVILAGLERGLAQRA
jgi:AcrR family transcriptional regulator